MGLSDPGAKARATDDMTERNGYKSLAERLIANSAISVNRIYNGEPCWEWLRDIHYKGYGRLCVHIPGRNNVTVFAHRLSAVELGGWTLPEDTRKWLVNHLCNNRACINPAHIKVDTAKTNMADMVAAGRNGGPGNSPYKNEQAALWEERKLRETADRLAMFEEFSSGAITMEQYQDRYDNYTAPGSPCPHNHGPEWWDMEITPEFELIMFSDII